jgi:hypothetical protein
MVSFKPTSITLCLFLLVFVSSVPIPVHIRDATINRAALQLCPHALPPLHTLVFVGNGGLGQNIVEAVKSGVDRVKDDEGFVRDPVLKDLLNERSARDGAFDGTPLKCSPISAGLIPIRARDQKDDIDQKFVDGVKKIAEDIREGIKKSAESIKNWFKKLGKKPPVGGGTATP